VGERGVEASGVFAARIGSGHATSGSDDLKLRDRNEINLQSRKQRRSRKGRSR
jgi:hypothetical protein